MLVSVECFEFLYCGININEVYCCTDKYNILDNWWGSKSINNNKIFDGKVHRHRLSFWKSWEWDRKNTPWEFDTCFESKWSYEEGIKGSRGLAVRSLDDLIVVRPLWLLATVYTLAAVAPAAGVLLIDDSSPIATGTCSTNRSKLI